MRRLTADKERRTKRPNSPSADATADTALSGRGWRAVRNAIHMAKDQVTWGGVAVPAMALWLHS